MLSEEEREDDDILVHSSQVRWPYVEETAAGPVVHYLHWEEIKARERQKHGAGRIVSEPNATLLVKVVEMDLATRKAIAKSLRYGKDAASMPD